MSLHPLKMFCNCFEEGWSHISLLISSHPDIQALSPYIISLRWKNLHKCLVTYLKSTQRSLPLCKVNKTILFTVILFKDNVIVVRASNIKTIQHFLKYQISSAIWHLASAKSPMTIFWELGNYPITLFLFNKPEGKPGYCSIWDINIYPST